MFTEFGIDCKYTANSKLGSLLSVHFDSHEIGFINLAALAKYKFLVRKSGQNWQK